MTNQQNEQTSMNNAVTTVRVLLVDDQRIIAEAVRRMLASESDIALRHVIDPAEALAVALGEPPSVILQDLVMPGIDGLALIKAYRAEESLRAVPIIVLSSRQDQVQMESSYAAGANDYLVKLPDKNTLLSRLRYHAAAATIYSSST
jgi:two-component system, chemotaxis family, response regulator WspR